MTESTWWWLLAGALIVLELLSGTFLLLMLASGAAAGALLAHLGQPMEYQLTAAAIVGALATAAWHQLLRPRQKAEDKAIGMNHAGEAMLDIGQTVTVNAWQPDGTAQVHYRGALWSARFRPRQGGDTPDAGAHRIAEIQSNVLILERL